MTKKIYKANCKSCEFNFGGTCAGHGVIAIDHDTYGMSIKSTLTLFPNGCDDWGLSLDAYIQLMKLLERSGYIESPLLNKGSRFKKTVMSINEFRRT